MSGTFDSSKNKSESPIALPPVSLSPGQSDSVNETEELHDQFPRIDGYRITRLIGHGGMGTVWQAQHLTNGRRVAIKMLRGSLGASPRSLARFKREIEILATLEHPNIARLYESSTDPQFAYYVMEYIDGIPIDQYCISNRMDIRHTVGLFFKVCQAIDYAQLSGFIHRDLKPSNILVRKDGSPCILDFGLAKSLAPAIHQTTLTVDGDIAGTLAYMPPEQAEGKHNKIDSRSDVYSLGIILYQLLCGKLPYDAMGSAFQSKDKSATPPSCRHINHNIDRELDVIISKAISFDLNDRYKTAGDLAEDIDNYLQGNPISARPLTLGYLIRKRIAQNRVRFTVFLVLLTVFLAIGSYSYFKIHAARNLAELRATERNQALYASRFREAYRLWGSGDIGEASFLLNKCSPELRNWEWGYLHQLTDQSQLTFSLPADAKAISVDNDGQSVSALDREGNLYLFRHNARVVVKRIANSKPDNLALSADGKFVAFSCEGKVEILSTDSPSRLVSAINESSPVRSLTISPRGEYVAILTNDNILTIYDSNTREVLFASQIQYDVIRMVFDGQSLYACVTGKKPILLFSPENASPNNPTSPSSLLDNLTIQYSSQHIAADTSSTTWAINEKNTIQIHDEFRGSHKLSGHNDSVNLLQMSVNGQYLVSVHGRTIKVWSTDPVLLHDDYSNKFDNFNAVVASWYGRNSKSLYIVLLDGRIFSVDLSMGTISSEYALNASLLSAACDEERGVIRALSNTNTLAEYDIDSKIMGLASHDLDRPTVSPTAEYLVTLLSHKSKTLGVYHASPPIKSITEIAGEHPWAWSGDGGVFAATTDEESLQITLWRTDSWKSKDAVRLPLPTHPLLVALSNNGRFICAAFESEIWVWNVEIHKTMAHLPIDNAGGIGALAIYDDGQRVLVGGRNLVLLDTTTGESILELDSDQQQSYISTITISPDQHTVFAGGHKYASWWRSTNE